MKSASIDPAIIGLLDRLAGYLKCEFQHRLETLEFKADYPHRLQKCIDLIAAMRHQLISQKRVTCLRVDLDGSTEFVITTDLEYARKHLADIGAEIIAEESIEDVIDSQYGDVAALCFLG